MDAYFNKGLSHKELKNYEIAISDFESTFMIDDSNFDAILNIAKCYELLNNNGTSLKHL